MRVEILSNAVDDLLHGYRFYERQSPGLGQRFLDSLYTDIESLPAYAGIHPIAFGKHRSLAKRFPYAIYYDIEGEQLRVHAVLDCRQSPLRTRSRLGQD